MTGQNQALASDSIGLDDEDLVDERGALAPDGLEFAPEPLVDDRQLLSELGMSDGDAAALLGRSRQALHQKLGPKSSSRKGGKGRAVPGRSEYFKVSDIFTLTSAARQLGRPFRADAILSYAERTRKKREPEAFALLESVLRDDPQPLEDIAGASAILMVLPGFAEMLVRFDRVGDFLVDIVEDARSIGDPAAQVFVVGPTAMQADIAGDWLGVAEDHCFGHESADLLPPTIIVFSADDQRVYTLTETGHFMGVPAFQRATMARRALVMLPPEMRTVASPRRSSRSTRRGG
jgi:hypothetical protein